jgi:hypothetical protein
MRRIILSIYVVVALATLVGWTQAATITVCPSGCDYSDLQAAVNSAIPGDNINVYSGTFDQVVLNKPLTLYGGRSGSVNINDCPSIGTIYKCGYTINMLGVWASIGKEVNDCVNPPCGKCSQKDSSKPLGTATRAPDLLYLDNFSTCGITYDTNANSQNAYCENGKMHLAVQEKEKSSFVLDPRDTIFNDFGLEVEATQENGPNDNDYGVILRHVDSNNFYRFLISGTGYYSFNKMQSGKWVDIVPWTKSAAIHAGRETNLIKVECKGNNFTFYVNGVKLRVSTDSSFVSGLTGLIIGTHSSGGVHVSFDNLKVWAL